MAAPYFLGPDSKEWARTSTLTKPKRDGDLVILTASESVSVGERQRECGSGGLDGGEAGGGRAGVDPGNAERSVDAGDVGDADRRGEGKGVVDADGGGVGNGDASVAEP